MIAKYWRNPCDISVHEEATIDESEVPPSNVIAYRAILSSQASDEHFAAVIPLMSRAAEPLQIEECRLFSFGDHIVGPFRLFGRGVDAFARLGRLKRRDHELPTKVRVGEDATDVDAPASIHEPLANA